MNKAGDNVATFQRGVDKVPGLKREIDKYQKQGDVVPPDDQAVQFVRLIQKQAAQSGVIIVSMGSQRQSGNTNNPFFVEQNETITLQSGEKQLVDFLYNLGAGNSLIRVKVLSAQPDQSHQQLTSRVTLIASYQKKAPTPTPRAAAPATAPAAKSPATPPAARPVVTNRAPFIPPPAPKTLKPIK
jgi:hypothetical protein